jgi:hypothetical protein
VAYRPVAGQGPQANGMRTIAAQRRSKYASTTIELLFGKHVPAATVTHAKGGGTGCYLRGPRLGIKKKRIGATDQLSNAREANKR